METAIQAIGRRRWDIISTLWRSYLPDDLEELPAAYKPLSTDELLLETMNGVGAGGEFEDIADAPKFRTMIFEAARFAVERCLYFTSTAEKLAAAGAPTAAVTVAYLCMMFGSRGMQSLLGIHYCFYQNWTWLIDIWPGASETSSQGKPKDWTPRTFALKHAFRIGHELHWKIFIRIRSITTRLPLHDDPAGVLRRLRDHGSFSARRNAIHYNDAWPYADLYRLLNEIGPGVLPSGFAITEQDVDHDLKLAQMIAFCAAHMMLDVLSPLPKFKGYCTQLRGLLSAERHPLLNSGALAHIVANLGKAFL